MCPTVLPKCGGLRAGREINPANALIPESLVSLAREAQRNRKEIRTFCCTCAGGGSCVIASRTAGTRPEPPVKKTVSISEGLSPASAMHFCSDFAKALGLFQMMARSKAERVATVSNAASIKSSGSTVLSASLRAILASSTVKAMRWPRRSRITFNRRADLIRFPLPRRSVRGGGAHFERIGEVDRGPIREFGVEAARHRQVFLD